MESIRGGVNISKGIVLNLTWQDNVGKKGMARFTTEGGEGGGGVKRVVGCALLGTSTSSFPVEEKIGPPSNHDTG